MNISGLDHGRGQTPISRLGSDPDFLMGGV
jgi:hypothetical protein